MSRVKEIAIGAGLLGISLIIASYLAQNEEQAVFSLWLVAIGLVLGAAGILKISEGFYA